MTLLEPMSDLSQEMGRTLPAPTPDRGLPVTIVGEAPATELGGVEEALGLEGRELIGRGGMGEVYATTQHALGRDVAVKVPTEGDRDGRRARHLLREGRAMGLLEHPNIVPVHHLGVGADGQPMLVMKRISGACWTDALRLPEGAAQDEESLGLHIETLMEVARAVEFAHSRGIAHRDIKPDNIMLGEYGEVYLLDWGIAVGLTEEHRGRLPMAADVDQPGGTPFYMAPEMIHHMLAPIGPRTDVYLLGATLHQVLTGRPPHQGETVLQVLAGIVLNKNERRYPPEAPQELVAIAERAMSYDPAERFESAAALRAALAESVRHRASRRLVTEAAARLAALEERLSTGAGQHARDLYAQGVFGCEQALRMWPDNVEAQAVRRELIVVFARLELARGRLDAADTLLEALTDAPAELLEEVARQRSARNEEKGALASLRHEADLTISAALRGKLACALAVGTFLYVVALAQMAERQPALLSGGLALATTTLLLVAFVGAALSRARGLLENRVNRQIMLSTVVTLGGVALIRVYGALHGESYAVLVVRTMLLWTVASGVLAATVDKRFLTAAASTFTAWLLSMFFPAASLHICAFGYLFAYGPLGVMWWREAKLAEAAAPRPVQP